MSILPFVVWSIVGLVVLAVLVVLARVARRKFGRRKGLQYLAVLILMYPALLVVVGSFQWLEWWVWVFVIVALATLAISRAFPRRWYSYDEYDEPQSTATPAPPAMEVEKVTPPAAQRTPPPNQTVKTTAFSIQPPAPEEENDTDMIDMPDVTPILSSAS